jgi:hypothetical protein
MQAPAAAVAAMNIFARIGTERPSLALSYSSSVRQSWSSLSGLIS